MISLPTQVLELTGPDALTFAQAQFCNDVRGLADANWQWSAWLNPQGRVRAFFHLLRPDAQTLLLILRGGDAQWLCAELARFVFRAKVRLRVVDDSRLTGSASADEVGAIAGAIPHDYACTPPGPVHALSLADDPSRWLLFGASHAPTANADARERWRLADIRAGLPEIGDELRDQMLPQWIGLDRLGAVNVRKGCYPGQEIMARLHFKGGNKRSLYGLWFPGESTPIAGTVVRNAGGNEAGTIVVAARDPGTNGVEALASMVDSTTAGKLQVEGQASVEITCQFG